MNDKCSEYDNKVSGCVSCTEINTKVTHWMPAPDLPVKKKELTLEERVANLELLIKQGE
jgi:hypothetical protein